MLLREKGREKKQKGERDVCMIAIHNTAAYDPLDPNENVTIKWDIVSWTLDGYVAAVTRNNFQMYGHIMSPGWTLGWTWAKREVIWSIVGAQTTEQAGVLPAWAQDPQAAVSAFQVSVGYAGTSNKTVKPPQNFTLLGPGPGYNCGPAKVVPPAIFLTPDRRRKTQALRKIRIVVFLSHLSTMKPSLLAHLVLADASTKTAVSNDIGIFYGVKYYIALLMEGPYGSVQSEGQGHLHFQAWMGISKEAFIAAMLFLVTFWGMSPMEHDFLEDYTTDNREQSYTNPKFFQPITQIRKAVSNKILAQSYQGSPAALNARSS
ncbi:hypothetical protein DITRI_Ditri11bG0028700 [Diplodiscus trichospermus]